MHKNSVYTFSITYRGKLFDEYYSDNDKYMGKNANKPLHYTDRPKIWNKMIGLNYIVTINDNNILFENSHQTLRGKFIGYTSWPIMDKPTNNLSKSKSQLHIAPVYSLNSFAGGHLIISPNMKYAERMIYGSGRHILSWEVGMLKKS